MSEPSIFRAKRLSIPVALSAALLLMTGCAAGEGAVSPTAPASIAPTAGEEAPVAPTFVPDGSAEDNLPIFTQIVATVWAGEDRLAGRAYVDALVAAGFDKAAMQLTPDQTTVNNPAESIQFSVLMGTECLMGQVGPSTGDPVAEVVPALAENRCLVGNTRAIDW